MERVNFSSISRRRHIKIEKYIKIRRYIKIGGESIP